jgi:hypothetical protein
VPTATVTAPVAVGAPVPPLTPTVTLRSCPGTTFDDAGVIVTVGVAMDTETLALPLAAL